MDTNTAIGWSEALLVIERRLRELLDLLEQKSVSNETVTMAARTRSQIATRITFGLRIAQWAAPLIELEREIAALRDKVLRVQFGGASGANTVTAPHREDIGRGLAKALDLRYAAP